MKYLILMICLGFLLFSCGDGNSSGNAKENKNLKEVVIERHSEGDKKIVGFYMGEGSNEVIVKRVYYYSQNEGGGKEKEENYKNGKLEGKYYEWSSDGNKSVDCNYKNGGLHGVYVSYDDSGMKQQEINYLNGKKHGKGIEWYDDGSIRIEFEAKFGLMEGELKYYCCPWNRVNKSGNNLEDHQIYSKGKLIKVIKGSKYQHHGRLYNDEFVY